MKHFKRKKLQSFLIGLTATTMIGIGTPSIADHYSDDGYDGGWSRSDSDRSDDGAGVTITFIHTGDFHGDYHPHTNGRADNAGLLEGGMARAVTVINRIRRQNDAVIHVHTGDTIHGSGEASITKGMALVKLVDQLGIDVSTPGNWEWAYTPYRYMQFFGVHDAPSGGTNMDIIPDASFDFTKYKSVKYVSGSQYEEDNIGDVPSFNESKSPFRAVKYVSGFDGDGNPIMKTGYNRWGMVAANAYENGTWALDHGVANKGTGMNLTPPYRIIEKAGVKIGFIGCTTNRGPQVVSSTITTGVTYSNCKGGVKFPQNRPIDWDDASVSHSKDDANNKPIPGGKVFNNPALPAVEAFNRDTTKEVADDANRPVNGWAYIPHWGGNWGYQTKNEIVKWTNYLRDVEKVDLVAVMSEAGIAENVWAAEQLKGMADGPDIYFSSDMHEETNFPIVTTDQNGKKVIIIENPEDIAQISELDVVIKNGKIASWSFKGHDVDERTWPNREMSDMVAQIDQDIASKIANGDAYNPYNGHKITYQLTEVVGETDDIVLERNRFSNEHDPANKIMPGVIEGTGHALITDVFRKLTGADIGGIRGFRYTNSVLDGDDIRYKDLYHFFPIGAQIAVAPIPTTRASEKEPPKKTGSYMPAGLTDDNYTVDTKTDYIEYIRYTDVNAQCKNDADQKLIDSNCNGVVFWDQADNKRHFIGFPRSVEEEMQLGMNSSHNPNVQAWGGGWSWQYSGITWDSRPSGPQFNKWGKGASNRISNIMIYDNGDASKNGPISSTTGAKATYASYYYHEDYNRINRNQIVTKGFCRKQGYTWPQQGKECAAVKGKVQILAKDSIGDYVMVDALEYDAGIGSGDLQVLDATEALGRYIHDDSITVYDWDGATGKGAALRTVAGLDEEFEGDDFVYPRANLVKADGTDGNDLTDCTVEFGFPCIQPIRGSEAAVSAGTVKLDNPYGSADAPASSGNF